MRQQQMNPSTDINKLTNENVAVFWYTEKKKAHGTGEPMLRLTLFFILLAAPGVWAKGTDNQLAAQLHTFLEGAGINDPAIHDSFWADELVYTSSNGTRFGKAALMKGVNETGKLAPQAVTTHYRAEDIDIRLVEQIALLNFTLVAETADNKITGNYLNSGVFVWRDNRWQAINWQATIKPLDQ